MTEKEKAKAYDKAMERTKKVYGNRITKEIFPELKEDNDERIRKDLIQWIDEFPGIIWRGHYKNDIIAWLEKQGDKDKLIQELGEYKVKYTQEVLEKYINSMSNKDDERLRKNCIHFLELQKQHHAATFEIEECIDWLENQGKKPTDKTKPRFNVGDWVIFIKDKSVYQIEKKENYEYTLRHILGGSLCLPFSNEELIKEWNIQDVKDGDILSFYSEYKGNKMFQIGIIEKYVGKHGGCSNTFKIYVGVDWDNNLKMDKYMGCSDIRPATKEQRDAFMKAIKDAGYEWDAEMKELKYDD